MPKPTKGPRLGGSPSHQRKILNNLAQSLFEHKQITTTFTRAKRVQPHAERLITFAKRGDLASRRRVLRNLSSKDIVAELFEELAPQFSERNGGYTRVTKVAPRQGDNAPMAVIELVLEPVSPKQATVREATRATESAAKKDAAQDEATEGADVEDEAVEAVEAEADDAETTEAADVAEVEVEQAQADEVDTTEEGAADQAEATDEDK